MLAGHVATAFAIKAYSRKVPLVIILLACMLLDIIAVVLVMLDVETFPGLITMRPRDNGEVLRAVYSHSLFWAEFYAVIVFLLFVKADGQRHWALPLSVGVFSHWILDLVNYRLPFANFGGERSFGLALSFKAPAIAIGLEIVLVTALWGIYYRAARANRGDRPTSAYLALGALIVLSVIPLLLRG